MPLYSPKLIIDINSPVQLSFGIKKKVCVRHTFFLHKSPGLSESRGFLIHEASALTCLLPLQPGRLQCRYTRAHTEAGSDGRENGQQSLDDKFPALTSRIDFYCSHSYCVFHRFCVFHSCCVFHRFCIFYSFTSIYQFQIILKHFKSFQNISNRFK